MQARSFLHVLELNGESLVFEGLRIFFKPNDHRVCRGVGQVGGVVVVAKLNELFVEGFVETLKGQRELRGLVLHI